LVDLVLTQKRIELAFEGFRIYDLLRNKKDVIRNYWGFHTNYVNGQSTGLVPGMSAPGVNTPYSYGRLVCPIPQQEILNNPACTQNEAYK
ncbi:MAG: RagB/SusD family nutrient uptake outer membrane protein, partial [Bacteroidales bacterium]